MFEQRLYKILAAGLLLTFGLATWGFLLPMSSKFMTEFYILGKNGFVADYPYEVKIIFPVTIGVVNQEQQEINYRIEVWVTDSLNPENPVRLTHYQFLIQPGEKQEQSISWHMPRVGDNQKVELLLFYNDDMTASRRLRMWINVE